MKADTQQEYYGKVNHLWQSAKTGAPSACLAIDLAELITKYFDADDRSDTTWQRFAKDLQQIGDKYQSERAQVFIEETAHGLMRMICKVA